MIIKLESLLIEQKLKTNGSVIGRKGSEPTI